MKKLLKLIILVAFSVLIFLTVYLSNNLKITVYNSLVFCAETIIPSLLPMLFTSYALINSNVIFWLPPKTTGLFLFILSSVCGYPSGSKIFSSLKIEKASVFIPITVCAGPAFIINFVGNDLLNSKKIGLMIYFSLVLSNLIVYLFNGGYKICIYKNTVNKSRNFILKSVKESVETVTTISSYLIIFSILTEIVRLCLGSQAKNIFTYLTEITCGVTNAKNVYLVCALLSFGGICVFMQILSISENADIKLFAYLKTRIICGTISLIFLKIMLKIFPQTVYTFTNLEGSPSISVNSGKAYVITLIFTLISLLISSTHSSTGKFLKDIEVI
ncbi:MAG: hypothetical protein E7565_09840 [Ruminococcaceae bacterium]|nr:hypothetical protein [Oscillospiraceae bacterium]